MSFNTPDPNKLLFYDDEKGNKCFNLFPIPFFLSHLDLDEVKDFKSIILEDFYKACADKDEYFKDYHLEKWANLQPVIEFCKGNGFLFQSRDDLFENEKFDPLSELILNSFEDYSTFLNLDIQSFCIHSMWYNIYKDSGMNDRHNHPNSFASGVIIVQDNLADNKDIPNFNVYNPSSLNQIIMPRFKDNRPSQYQSYGSNFVLESGTLIMFPSYLDHSATYNSKDPKRFSEPNSNLNLFNDTEDEWRITLAFNIMIKGEAGVYGSYFEY